MGNDEGKEMALGRSSRMLAAGMLLSGMVGWLDGCVCVCWFVGWLTAAVLLLLVVVVMALMLVQARRRETSSWGWF